MRQFGKFAGRSRAQERFFFTEAEFLKFAQRRDENDLTNLVFIKPDSSNKETPTELCNTAEATPLLSRAKGAFA